MLSNLSVITGAKMTDATVPADLPISEWIDQLVESLGKQFEGQDIGFDFRQETAWSLAKPGQAPVPPHQSLNDAEVVDGNQVFVRPVSRTERYQGRVEDVIDAIAILPQSPEFDRPALLSWLSWWTALTLVLVAAGGLYGYSTSTRAWPWWGAGLVVIGLGCTALAAQIRRRDQKIASAVAVGAIANLVVGVGLLVPLPERYTWLGAPHVAGAALALLGCSILLGRSGPTRWRAWTAFFALGSVVCAGAAFVISYGGKSWVWAAVAAAGLILLRRASKLVVWVARIAMPPIPPPGMEVGMDELLDPVVDIKAEAGDSNRQTWAKILASVPKSSARLAERSELCQQLLAGFMGAASAALAVGAVGLLQQGHFLVHTVVLCVLAVAVLLFWARLPEDRRCVWSLLSAAAFIAAGTAVKMALWWPAWAPVALGAVLVVTGLALVAVAAGPYRLNQAQERQLEHVNTVVVALSYLMVAWASGLFDFVRNLSIPGAN